jgi:transposase
MQAAEEKEDYGWLVGIDWATDAHEVCILTPSRELVTQRKVEHNGPAIAAFIDQLMRLCEGKAARVAISIEIPRGAVVESLVERGFHVYAINPKQLDRFRDRHTVAGAKDDRRDAFVLADSLRTDRPCFRQVRVDDPLVIQLREMSRVDDDLAEDMNRLTNRLREQLHRYYAALLRLSPSADEPWLWALLELAPTPADGARLKPKQIAKLLTEHRIRRLDAEAVRAALTEAPLHVAPGATEAAAAHIRTLIPRLRVTVQQRATCQREMARLLDELAAGGDASGQKNEHRDVQILRSLVGVGKKVAATLLAEASQPLGDRDYHALRAHAGVAPVTKQSGRRLVVVMRQACNGRLRNAVYHWARVAVTRDPRSTEVYGVLRARGQSHGRALRSVADRLLRLLIAMLKSKTLFDPTRWAHEAPAAPAAAVPEPA